MKKCIWCSKTEKESFFNKDAHIVPQSLGGKLICENVCDDCNFYFGNLKSGNPPVEIVLKEIMNLTRYLLLKAIGKTGKNKPLRRFKSEFFNVNEKSNTISSKTRYQLKGWNKTNMTKQFKRGLYKIFLESLELKLGKGNENKYDFIREFARYDLNDDTILLYMRPPQNYILFHESTLKDPELLFGEYQLERMESYGFYEFTLMGHWFAIATIRTSYLTLETYIKYKMRDEHYPFKKITIVNSIDDIDFMLKEIG